MKALNVAYGAAESRPVWKQIPLSIAFTLALVAMFIMAALLMMIGPHALQWLSTQVGLRTLFVITWTWMRSPAVLVLLMVGVATVYYAAPNVDHRFHLVSVGSALSVTAWITGSIAFFYYVDYFPSYSILYESTGALIVLLLYLYLSAVVLLFGAEINAVIERKAAATEATPHASRKPNVSMCVTNASESLRCYTQDGSRPPEAGLQERTSNRPMVLRLLRIA